MSLENLGAKVVKDVIKEGIIHAEKVTTKVETEVTVKTTVTQEKTVIDAALINSDKAVVDLGKLKQGTVGESMKLFDEEIEKQNDNISVQATKLVKNADNYAEFSTVWDGKSNQPTLKGFVDKMMENPIAEDNVIMNALKNVNDKTGKLSNSSGGSSFLYGAADFIKNKRIDGINDLKSLNEFLGQSLKVMDVYKVKGVQEVDKNVVIRAFAETALNSDIVSNEAKGLLRGSLNQASNVKDFAEANKIILDGFKKAAEVK